MQKRLPFNIFKIWKKNQYFYREWILEVAVKRSDFYLHFSDFLILENCMSAYGKRELFLILIFWEGSNEGLKTHLAHQDDDHAHVWAQADINKVLNKCWQKWARWKTAVPKNILGMIAEKNDGPLELRNWISLN